MNVGPRPCCCTAVSGATFVPGVQLFRRTLSRGCCGPCGWLICWLVVWFFGTPVLPGKTIPLTGVRLESVCLLDICCRFVGWLVGFFVCWLVLGLMHVMYFTLPVRHPSDNNNHYDNESGSCILIHLPDEFVRVPLDLDLCESSWAVLDKIICRYKREVAIATQ